MIGGLVKDYCQSCQLNPNHNSIDSISCPFEYISYCFSKLEVKERSFLSCIVIVLTSVETLETYTRSHNASDRCLYSALSGFILSTDTPRSALLAPLHAD